MNFTQNHTARGIQDVLGPAFRVQGLEALTRSANEAAFAIGFTVDHIAKSPVFCTQDDESVPVIVSGTSRVDETKVSAQLGKPHHRVDAQFGCDKTRFSIGGGGPQGHRTPRTAVIDAALQKISPIWIAAGTSNAVLELDWSQLVGYAAAPILEVRL